MPASRGECVRSGHFTTHLEEGGTGTTWPCQHAVPALTTGVTISKAQSLGSLHVLLAEHGGGYSLCKGPVPSLRAHSRPSTRVLNTWTYSAHFWFPAVPRTGAVEATQKRSVSS